MILKIHNLWSIVGTHIDSYMMFSKCDRCICKYRSIAIKERSFMYTKDMKWKRNQKSLDDPKGHKMDRFETCARKPIYMVLNQQLVVFCLLLKHAKSIKKHTIRECIHFFLCTMHTTKMLLQQNKYTHTPCTHTFTQSEQSKCEYYSSIMRWFLCCVYRTITGNNNPNGYWYEWNEC